MTTVTVPKADKINLIGKLLYIVDKRGVVVPYKFNKVQRHFHSNKGKRNIILKARQLGISSSILADMFITCLFVPHTQCAVVSHETRATQRLLDRVQFFYDSMDEPKPLLGAESRSEKTIPEMHSALYIGTCGSRAFSRGDTINKAHLSEAAFYEAGVKLLSGIQDAVPLEGELNLESSPNGEDEVFHDNYVKAKEGKSPYKAFFYPWWWDEGYRIPRNPSDPDVLNLLLPQDRGELEYTEDELFLVETYGLDEDQIRWRRFKISEKHGYFFVEYPENDVDCFVISGEPVFSQEILSDMAMKCNDGQSHLLGWTYWLPPEEKLRYIIGVDTASGASEGSYSAACVLNDRWEICATYQARLEPHQFALLLKELGKWYNTANIVIERNFTGYAVLEQLQDYPNIAYQRDFTTGKMTTQRGWWSNDQTRSMIMTITRENLGSLKIWDSNLVRQLRSYRYIKLKTKYREQALTHDDLAIALMLAVTARKVVGTARGYMGSCDIFGW